MHRKNQGSPFLAEFIRNCTPFGIDPPRPTKSCVLYKYKKHCTYSFIHSDPCSSRTEMDAAKDQPQTVMQPSRHLSILRSGCGEKPRHLTQQIDVLNCQESHSQQRKSCLSRRLRIKRASFLFRNFPSNNRDSRVQLHLSSFLDRSAFATFPGSHEGFKCPVQPQCISR